MSYLERLKKLNTPTLPTDTTDTRTSGSYGSAYSGHIREIKFLADSQIKLNQSRCSDCINLYPCPSARNINVQCPTNYKFNTKMETKNIPDKVANE